MSTDNRRNFYRLNYPEAYHPKLRMNGANYRVLDLSEQGLRFHMGTASGSVHLQDEVVGTLNFTDGESFIIRGNVSRVNEGEISVNLKVPIALRKIMAEQRILIEK